jgi:hypothetical protein
MTTNLFTRTSANPRRSKALSLALVSILAVVLLVGFGGLRVSASASTSFDNVQVFVHTSQDLPYSYALTVYNTSGIQVAYYQSNFPAAAFELPSGTYLFTVQASYGQVYYPCIGCVSGPIPGKSTTSSSTTTTNYTTVTGSATPMVMRAMALSLNDSGPMIPANSTSTTNSTTPTNSTTVTVKPIYIMAQSSNEYGYSVDQITGPSTITINTYNATDFPTTQVTVHVAYVNGTAAQGAWVYASVVDDYYYYGSNFTSSAQTGADGTAVLTMPKAPLLVTSYISVPITLPQPNVTVIIGGQKVNVTVYYYPTSVTLEGQTLILPPQTSGSITLHYQPQQYYYPLPLGLSKPSGVTNTSSGTVTSITTTTSTTMSASQNTAQGRIPPFSPANVEAATPVKPSTLTTTVAAKRIGGESLLQVGATVTIAAALATLTFVLVTVRGKRKPDVVSA